MRTPPFGAEPIPTTQISLKKANSLRIQIGALPYRFTAIGTLEFLLVTTRQSRRWTIPKGWPIKGMRPAEAAAQEAFEEAGVRGHVGGKPIGSFTYDKLLDDSGLWVPCEVLVFPLQVTRQRGVWPERGEREVRWFSPLEAAAIVDWGSLGDLMSAFTESGVPDSAHLDAR